jgi:hypothetical protein
MILNTASGRASFRQFWDITRSSSDLGPNQSATIFAICFGDFENFPHLFSTTYGTLPASCQVNKSY